MASSLVWKQNLETLFGQGSLALVDLIPYTILVLIKRCGDVFTYSLYHSFGFLWYETKLTLILLLPLHLDIPIRRVMSMLGANLIQSHLWDVGIVKAMNCTIHSWIQQKALLSLLWLWARAVRHSFTYQVTQMRRIELHLQLNLMQKHGNRIGFIFTKETVLYIWRTVHQPVVTMMVVIMQATV